MKWNTENGVRQKKVPECKEPWLNEELERNRRISAMVAMENPEREKAEARRKKKKWENGFKIV